MPDQRKRKFSVVISAGNRLDSLVALRDRIARAIDTASPRDLGPLSRQLTALLAEIERLKPSEEVSKSDELATARAVRLAAIAGMPDAAAEERSTGS